MVLFVYYGYKILNFFGPKKYQALEGKSKNKIDIFGLINEDVVCAIV